VSRSPASAAHSFRHRRRARAGHRRAGRGGVGRCPAGPHGLAGGVAGFPGGLGASGRRRPHPGQQFVQHHAERIDVRGRGQQLALQLLRRGVGGGQQARAGVLRQRCAAVRVVGCRQQPGDAEVQQPHLAIGRDQDVAGLEVAMDDQPRMRVLHRVEHLVEQGQPAFHAQPLAVAPLVHGSAVGDPFHRHPGRAVGVDAGVVQPCDVRVLQPRQDVALAREALGQSRHQGQPRRQLQRHRPRQ
jgi:hypothetical protein